MNNTLSFTIVEIRPTYFSNFLNEVTKKIEPFDLQFRREQINEAAAKYNCKVTWTAVNMNVPTTITFKFKDESCLTLFLLKFS